VPAEVLKEQISSLCRQWARNCVLPVSTALDFSQVTGGDQAFGRPRLS